jgi:hypothetical protein
MDDLSELLGEIGQSLRMTAEEKSQIFTEMTEMAKSAAEHDTLADLLMETGRSVYLEAEEKNSVITELESFVAFSESRDDLILQLQAVGESLVLNESEHSVMHAEIINVRTVGTIRQLESMPPHLTELSGTPDPLLRDAERREMRRSIVDFVKAHPHEQDAPEEIPVRTERMDFASMLSFFLQGILPRTMALACVFLVIGSSAAYASETALPGDWLYQLKVDIVEPVRGRLTSSSESRAAWESTRALRRLEEAEQLAAHNRLDEKTWTKLHGKFVEHVGATDRLIEDTEKKGKREEAMSMRKNLEVYLGAHHSVITALGHNGDLPYIAAIAENVEKARNEAERKRKEKEMAAGNDSSDSSSRHANAEQAIRDARTEIESIRRSAGTGNASVDLRLKQAEDSLIEADLQLNGGQSGAAHDGALSATRKAAEAKIMLKLPVKVPVITDEKQESSASSVSSEATVSSASTESKSPSSLPAENSSSSLKLSSSSASLKLSSSSADIVSSSSIAAVSSAAIIIDVPVIPEVKVTLPSIPGL